jgi:hypothetical protein
MPIRHGGTFASRASSYTCGIGVLSAERRQPTLFLIFAIFTFALGAAFLFIEATEFAGMVAKGAGPSRSAFLSSFVNLQASEFAATQVVPTAGTSVSDVQGGCGVYVRAQRGLLPPRASNCEPSEFGQLTAKVFHLLDLQPCRPLPGLSPPASTPCLHAWHTMKAPRKPGRSQNSTASASGSDLGRLDLQELAGTCDRDRPRLHRLRNIAYEVDV